MQMNPVQYLRSVFLKSNKRKQKKHSNYLVLFLIKHGFYIHEFSHQGNQTYYQGYQTYLLQVRKSKDSIKKEKAGKEVHEILLSS